MTIITAVLDFLLMTWIFWPIIVVLPFVAFYNVFSAVKEDEVEVFAGAVIAAIVGILAYKFPVVRGYFDGWRAWCVILGGYVSAGFLLSLYKWLVVLWDFRKADVKGRIQSCRNSYNAEMEKGRSSYIDSVKQRIQNLFEKCVVEENNDNTFSVFPNWRKYPIGLWWVYWPFFLLELPFDFVKRIAESLFQWLRHFYNSVAKKFAVRG